VRRSKRRQFDQEPPSSGGVFLRENQARVLSFPVDTNTPPSTCGWFGNVGVCGNAAPACRCFQTGGSPTSWELKNTAATVSSDAKSNCGFGRSNPSGRSAQPTFRVTVTIFKFHPRTSGRRLDHFLPSYTLSHRLQPRKPYLESARRKACLRSHAMRTGAGINSARHCLSATTRKPHLRIIWKVETRSAVEFRVPLLPHRNRGWPLASRTQQAEKRLRWGPRLPCLRITVRQRLAGRLIASCLTVRG
jgi:hypothetical protein